jgi:uncharacterized protein YdaU (DUF1376 family)
VSQDRSPAFQFYPRDFLSDANVIAMSMQERGVYITLLCNCWNEGTLPADTDRLARLCGLPISAFRKFWPAVEVCFSPADDVSRLIHKRLEREREKQELYRRRQSDKGKASGISRRATGCEPDTNRGSTVVQPETNRGSTAVEPRPVEPDTKSSSAICNLQSASAEKTVPPTPDARSNRPIFRGQRFAVFEWMLDDLRRMLGEHADTFDLHAWFFDLDAKAAASGLVVPQRDGGKWLQESTMAEAIRRGLPVAAPAKIGKTAGNMAAAARFVARGRES